MGRPGHTGGSQLGLSHPVRQIVLNRRPRSSWQHANDGRSAPEHAPRAFRVHKCDGRRLCSRLRVKSARIWARTQSAPVGIDAFLSNGHWCSFEDEICSDLRPSASSEHTMSAGPQWERAACSARDECALWARLRGCLLLASLEVTRSTCRAEAARLRRCLAHALLARSSNAHTA